MANKVDILNYATGGVLRTDDYPASKEWQLVGQRCGQNGQWTGSSSQKPHLNCHTKHFIPTGADAIQVIYNGFYIQAATPGEMPLTPSVFTAEDLTFSGGTGYVVGEVVTFPVTTSTGNEAVKVMITAVNSGVPTQAQIIAGGIYNTPLSGAQTQATTTGSGTGLSCTFTWKAYALGGHIGIELPFNNQAFTGTSPVQLIKNGMRADGKINWSALIPMGGVFKSDIIPCDIPIGGTIGIRANLGWMTTQAMRQYGRLPMIESYGITPSVEGSYTGDTWYDLAVSGTFPTGGDGYIFQPVAIMGIPKIKLPSIMAIGDSRTVGNASGVDAFVNPALADLMDEYGNMGPFEKALNQDRDCFYPWTNYSKGGQQLGRYLATTSPTTFGSQNLLDIVSMIRPTAVYLNLNVNDFGSANQSVAQVLAWETELVQKIKGCGVKYVFGATTEPETSSTDGWATEANQTVRGSGISANITTRNTMLLAGTWTAGYDFFVDMQLISETSRTSGKWVTNGTAGWSTGDGIHASPYIIGLQADSIAEAIKANIPADGS